MNAKIEMHPFLKYPGGKTKEIPLVINNLPKTVDRFIEPFVGGESIYFAMNTRLSFINDKSTDLYNLFFMIKNQDLLLKEYLFIFEGYWKKLSTSRIEDIQICEDFIDRQSLLKFYKSAMQKKEKTIAKFRENGTNISRDDLIKIEITARKTAFYMEVRRIYNLRQNNIQLHIASFYFLRQYCYSSMFRFSSKGDFNVPYGGRSYNEKYMHNKINYMFSNEMENYMKHTVISNEDFEVFMDGLNLTPNDFIFLDPPYDSDFSTYDNNPFDRDEQIRLRDFVAKTKAKWMLIIKKTDFILIYIKTFIYMNMIWIIWLVAKIETSEM